LKILLIGIILFSFAIYITSSFNLILNNERVNNPFGNSLEGSFDRFANNLKQRWRRGRGWRGNTRANLRRRLIGWSNRRSRVPKAPNAPKA